MYFFYYKTDVASDFLAENVTSYFMTEGSPAWCSRCSGDFDDGEWLFFGANDEAFVVDRFDEKSDRLIDRESTLKMISRRDIPRVCPRI